MKTFNTKLIVALITTLVLTGCMPDSLTKFKKDAPTKAAATAPTPDMVDSNGNPVDPDSLEYPSKFYFVSEGSIPSIELPVGTAAELTPMTDGSIADPTLRSLLFVKCELITDATAGTTTTTLPPGLGFSQPDCKITGTPTQIHSNNGAPIQYTVQMHYKGPTYAGVGTEELIKAHVKIGVYQAPVNLAMTQTDKLQIVLNPAGGTIASIASNPDSSIAYNRYGVLTSSNGISGVVKYVDTTSGTVGVNRSQAIAVDTVASVGSNEFIISSTGKQGKIVSVNTTTKTIYVEPLLSTTVFAPNDSIGFVSSSDIITHPYPGNQATILQPLTVSDVTSFVAGTYLTTAGGAKRGRVDTLNTTAKVLFVRLLSPNVAFAANDQIDAVASSFAPFVSAKSSVSSVTTIFSFQNGEKLDNDKQYFSEQFNIAKITQMFPTEKAIEIAPIASSTINTANGIKYTIAPALPSGLSFSSTTGKITGQFDNTMNSTAYTITGTNSLGSTAATIYLAAINPPKDLSYTSNQLITVNSYASFLDGESLFQPIIAPLTKSVSGRILRKVSPNMLSIETTNGSFLAGASLDSGNAYYNEKSYIKTATAPNYFNLALTVSSTTGFTNGIPAALTYVESSDGAKGRVVYVDTASKVIYVQFLTPNISSSIPSGATVTPFIQNSTIISNGATIDQVEASNMILTLSSVAAFNLGSDFTTNANSSGYIYDLDIPTRKIKINEINRTGTDYIKTTQSIGAGEYYTYHATINGVTHDNLITIERGIPRVINANVSQGTSLTYSISPALPTGLTLNVLTGVISGTPTAMSARKSYVVTAINLLDKVYYAFDLEVRDHFTFSESSGAKSFLTHKIGSSRTHRPCRINSVDILDGNNAATDIGCELEAEELELFYAKLKMKAAVGGGVCDYIGFKPYSFWQYAPEQTARTIDYATNGCTGIAGSVIEAPTAANSCYGNYTADKGPNCDAGTVTVKTYTSAAPGGACGSTPVESTIDCGGTKISCLAGPVTSVITDTAQLEKGFREKTIFAAEGLENTWEIKSSVEFLDVTNLRNANGVVSNGCLDTRADAKTWANQTLAETIAPHGKENPFYEFTCLDAATDVKARIRVVVREWNRTFKINDLINDVIPVKMNTTVTDPIFGSTYNQFRDWDDDYTGNGTAAIQTCGAVPGRCSIPAHKSSTACTAATGVWTANGLCVGATGATPTICEKNGGAWDSNSFRFPGADI